MAKIDVPVITNNAQESRGKRWVEVPATDLFEFPFPAIRVNLMEFGPGKHYVDADLGDWIETRIKVKENADRRVLMRNPDTESQNILTRFGSGRGGNYVKNPDAVMQ